ncbi:MAG: sigma-70 family RNA polymerase sigma factor [Bacteroidetes bacterium]|jgi:RNA polymerase sigma factor (sigma-70 family)|nr:sigma-70 family RNA polymerase sigma factor [Bacteroidota bacterium]
MKSKLPSDKWDKFVRGDHDSFRELFNGYYKGLYGYGLKICGKPDLVEDAIQNLFTSIWERRDELEHIESPNVYLFISLRRSILNKIKQQNRRDEIVENVHSNYDIYFGAEEIIIKSEMKHEQKERLRKALNQLSNKQKEVLYLHYYNGMSYGEIEEILCINRQSVRNHMYRAMETLRAVMGNHVMRLVISLLLAFLGI